MLVQFCSKLRTDNDKVFTSKEFRAKCTEFGFILEFAAPYSQHQNGVAERMWRTLEEMALAMCHSAGLGKEYWVLAMKVAVYIRCRTYSKAYDCIAYEKFHNKKVDLSHLKKFGCKAYVHIDKSLRRKFEPKAKACLFVGYCADSAMGTYELLFPEEKRIIRSRNVIFN